MYTLYKNNRVDQKYTASAEELCDRFLESHYVDYNDWPIYRKVSTWLTCDEEAVPEDLGDIDRLVDDIVRLTR